MPGKTLYCLGEAWLELNSTAPLASAKTFSPRMGGSAASLALAYAAQGGRASLLTQLGEDAFGHRIADALSTAGVDISRVCFTSRAPTPLLFDGGGETLACRTRSSELLYAPEQLGADWAADAEMLAFSSACLVDSPCRYTHLAALDAARTAGVPVCFVPSLRPALWPSPEDPAGHGDAVSPLRGHPLPHRRRDGASAGHPRVSGRTVCPAAGAYPAGGA